jgi:hypothetical protein
MEEKITEFSTDYDGDDECEVVREFISENWDKSFNLNLPLWECYIFQIGSPDIQLDLVKTIVVFRVCHCVGDGHSISQAFGEAFESNEKFSYQEDFINALESRKNKAKIPSLSIWLRVLQFFYMVRTLLAVLFKPFLPAKNYYWIYENKPKSDSEYERQIASSISIPISTVILILDLNKKLMFSLDDVYSQFVSLHS